MVIPELLIIVFVGDVKAVIEVVIVVERPTPMEPAERHDYCMLNGSWF